MAMMKRIFLFLLTNLAVLVVLNIVIALLENFLGINISGYGFDIKALLFFAFTVGFTGALVSLFMSKWTAKRAYNIQLIDESKLFSVSDKEKLVYTLVRDIANKEGIKTPEVGIYQAADPNAFATGATKNSSLVAVSTGLLNMMSEKEIEGVIAHEMAHITNGDMVTMTLLQGIINTFVIFFARILATIADSVLQSNQQSDNSESGSTHPSFIYFIVSFILEIVFSMLASVIVMWFSRHREYRADEGSARYVGKEKMIAALEALKKGYGRVTGDSAPLATYRISSKEKGGLAMLFSSHPSLDSRISNLENMRM